MGHVQRRVVTGVFNNFDASLMSFARRVLEASSSSPICLQCQSRPSTHLLRSPARLTKSSIFRKAFSSADSRRRDLEPVRIESKETQSSSTIVQDGPSDTSGPAPGSLPSSTENQRWPASRRLSKLMDDVLAKASIAGQHINEYTGTDYTAIDALRREIGSQEQTVRDRIAATDTAKSRHHDTHSDQTAAQREIVGLLERKASWSPTDLERYMALVRSEHVNEQAVQAAKENLQTAERELEDARAVLERLERKRYHEEQIWSDTIRRNSTWVTFGLMGVNIILLLAQITVFEPYRRQKIVHDVKAALDEKTFTPSAADTPAVPETLAVKTTESEVAENPLAIVLPSDTKSKDGPSKQLLDPVLAHESSKVLLDEQTAAKDMDSDIVPMDTTSAPEIIDQAPPPLTVTDSIRDKLRYYESVARDQFSDRIVQLQKKELSAAVLVSSLAGTLVTCFVVAALRSR